MLLNGARNCSIVGAIFCLAFEELDMFLLDDLKKGVLERGRNIFAHDEHVQAASLQPRPDIVRGKVFISLCVLAVLAGRKSTDVKPFPKSADDGKTLIRPMTRRSLFQSPRGLTFRLIRTSSLTKLLSQHSC